MTSTTKQKVCPCLSWKFFGGRFEVWDSRFGNFEFARTTHAWLASWLPDFHWKRETRLYRAIFSLDPPYTAKKTKHLLLFQMCFRYQEPQKPMKMSYLQKTRCFLGKHDVFGKHRIFDFKQFPIHSFNSSSVLKRSQKHHLNLRISHRPPLLHSQRNQLRIRHSSFATPT